MKVLGISAYYHDSAAAVAVDGIIVAAIQEERLTRIKHDNRFPILSCKWCLDYCGLDIDDIDMIVFYEKPFLKFERILESIITYTPSSFKSFLKVMPIWVGGKLDMKRLIRKTIKANFVCKQLPEIRFIEHHMAHAASAYYTSIAYPHQMVALLAMDAVGEKATTSLMVAKDGNIRTLFEQHYAHSVGLLYSAFTYFLGFKVNSDEYKVMGLAPYGETTSDETKRFVKIITSELVDIGQVGDIRLNTRHFKFMHDFHMIDPNDWEQLFGIAMRLPSSPISQSHKNLAFAIQSVTEDIACRLATRLKEETNTDVLYITGGCAMNCVMNSAVRALGLFREVYVPHSPADEGCAIGAALAVSKSFFSDNANPFLGPSYSDECVLECLKSTNLKYLRFPDEKLLCAATAETLSNGKIVGWFQGRMEFGQRALGNRSILADARDAAMKARINAKVKYREEFRPFAPVVLKEEAPLYFGTNGSPYMMFTTRVKTAAIPAVTHVDNTARIQTVGKHDNPLLHLLLNEYKKRTGIPVLLNTSFNVMGEPIVCSPQDAIKTFYETDIDVLVMGQYLITK